jgi:Family of unknown function (DUF6499)
MPTESAWTATAGYLYLLQLDAPSLAWEYLRRNPDYRAMWRRLGSHTPLSEIQTWGLRFRRGPPTRCSRSSPRLVVRSAKSCSNDPRSGRGCGGAFFGLESARA